MHTQIYIYNIYIIIYIYIISTTTTSWTRTRTPTTTAITTMTTRTPTTPNKITKNTTNINKQVKEVDTVEEVEVAEVVVSHFTGELHEDCEVHIYSSTACSIYSELILHMNHGTEEHVHVPAIQNRTVLKAILFNTFNNVLEQC